MASKRRGRGEGSVFPEANGKYRATISLGSDANGKRIRRSRIANSKLDALAFIREMQDEHAAASLSPRKEQTLSEWLSSWLRDVVEPNKSENTTASYRLPIETHIVPKLGHVNIRKLTPQMANAFFSGLQREEIGDRTRENAYVVLRLALDKAVQWGLMADNPVRKVEKPKYERQDIFPLTLEESQALMKAAIGSNCETEVIVGITTGMRQGELLGLHWEHVDLKAGKLEIVQQLKETKGRLSLGPPKTKKGKRTIDLTPAAVDALVRQKARQMKSKTLAGNVLVFPSRRGGFMRKSNFLRSRWRPLLAKAGIEYRGFHHLRHTYATLALGAGTPVHVVSAVLGHAQVSTTLNTYSHVLKEQSSRAAEDIARLLG